MKTRAARHANERIKYEHNRFNRDHAARVNMVLIGTLGELVFCQFLNENDVEFQHNLQAGVYDKFDFFINGKIWEIKTSGYDGYFDGLNLLYNVKQWKDGEKKGFDFCVLIFINGYHRGHKILNIDECNQGTIAGYIPFNEIPKHDRLDTVYSKNYKVPTEKLIKL